jgi:hypothetical protein
VSNNPSPFPLPFVHNSALASSPERPLRPLPAPAAGEAQSLPLTPRSRAHASPPRFELSCRRVTGREHRPGATPASSRRVPPHSGDVAAASRTLASRVVGSCTGGSHRIPLRFEWAVHRGPVHRVHGAVHRTRASPRPLDLRSTVRLRPFPLRVPGKFYIHMPVLPPKRILAVRSSIL